MEIAREQGTIQNIVSEYFHDTSILAPIRNIPEQHALIARFKSGDQNAAHRLVGAFMWFGIKVAKTILPKFVTHYTPHVVVQIVVEAIMSALNTFEVSRDRGSNLTTLVDSWVRGLSVQHILNSAYTCKISVHTRSENGKSINMTVRFMRAYTEAFKSGLSREDAIAYVAAKFDPKEYKYIKDLGILFTAEHIQLDAPVGESAETCIGDDFPDELVPSPEDAVLAHVVTGSRRKFLAAALEELPSRAREILTSLRLCEDEDAKPSLDTLAVQYGISRSRVHQIDAWAFKKLCKIARRMQVKGLIAV